MVWYKPKNWFAKKIKPSDTDIGSPYITPAESAKGSTGTVVTGTPTSVIPTGNVQTAIKKYSGGGGGSPAPTPTPTTTAPTAPITSIIPKGDIQKELTKQAEKEVEKEYRPSGLGTKDKGSLFSFRVGGGGVRQEFGVPFVTKKEEKQMRESGSTMPVYALESTSMVDAFQESQDIFDVGGVQTSPSSFLSFAFGRTKEATIFDKSSVLSTQFKVQELSKVRGEAKEFYDIKQKEYEKDITGFAETRQGYYQELIDTGKMGFSGATDLFGREVSAKSTSLLGSEKFSKEFTFDVGRFDFKKESVLQAKDWFKSLAPSTQARAGISSQVHGYSKVGIGLAEFGGTLVSSIGIQKLEKGEKFSLVGKQFRFGGELGKIRASPSMPTSVGFLGSPLKWIGEKAESPQLFAQTLATGGLVIMGGGGMFSNIKRLGFKGGVTETLSMLSPLRVKGGIYTSKIASTSPVKIETFKIKSGDFVYKYSVGVSSDYTNPFATTTFTKLGAGGKGFSTTQIISPATKISLGGAKFTSGISTMGTESIITGGAGGKVTSILGDFKFGSDFMKGGIGGSLTQQRYSMFMGEDKSLIMNWFTPSSKFIVGRGAGFEITGQTEGIKQIGFGERYASRRLLLDKGSFVYELSGKYSFRPSITGREYNLNQVLGFKDTSQIGFKSGGFSSGGKGLTPLSKTFSIQQSVGDLSAIKTSLGMKIAPVTTSFTTGLKLVQLPITKTKQITQPVYLQVSKQNQFDLSKMKQEMALISLAKTSLKEKQMFGMGSAQLQPQIITQLQPQKLRQKIVQKQIVEPLFEPFSKFDFRTPVQPFQQKPYKFGLFAFPFLPSGGGGFGGSITTGKRKFVPTIDLASALKYQLGFKQRKVGTKLQRQSGIYGRSFKGLKIPKIKLPSLLLEVKKRKKKE